MGYDKGEYGKVLNQIEKRFTCPAYPDCPKTFETEREAMKHFDSDHSESPSSLTE